MVEQRGDCPVLVMHDGVTMSIFAQMIPMSASHALKALGLTDVEGLATLGTNDVGGPKTSQSSELRRTAKWRDLREARV